MLSLLVVILTVAPATLGDPHQFIALDGTWEGRLADGRPLDEGSEWRAIRVPGNLPFQGITYDGVFWLRRRFELTYAPVDLAVRLPTSSNAYELFINGHLVGSNGRIGPSGELEKKDLRTRVFRLPAEWLRQGGPNVLELRLRTFYGNGGVQAPGVLLGPEELVRHEQERRVSEISMLAALFAFAAFFFFVLFVGRTRDRQHLSFAMLSSSLASITVGINSLGFLVVEDSDVNAWLVFVPLLVMPFNFVLFFSDFFSRGATRLKRATLALAIVGVVVLVASTLHHPLFPLFERVVMPVSVLALVAALAQSAWWTFRALREGLLGASAVLVGMGVYALTGVLELAWVFDLLNVRIDSNVGFAFFVCAMVVAMARRFAFLHRQVEAGERDALTGCLTRHGFQGKLPGLLSDSVATCIMYDLDFFKLINDTHGHQVGDSVLAATSGCIRSVLRSDDVIVRWGGEEFLVLLPGTDVTRAIEVAQRMQSSLKRQLIGQLSVTASFGVATRGSNESFEAWVGRADRALYEAKEAGRDCVRTAA